MIETLLPQIQKHISEKAIETLKGQAPKVIFTSVYNMMPYPVRVMVKEDSFVKFCITHQEKLFGTDTSVKKSVSIKKAIPVKKAIAVKKSAPQKAPIKKAVKTPAKKSGNKK